MMCVVDTVTSNSYQCIVKVGNPKVVRLFTLFLYNFLFIAVCHCN